jgi:hypothetical protein
MFEIKPCRYGIGATVLFAEMLDAELMPNKRCSSSNSRRTWVFGRILERLRPVVRHRFETAPGHNV